ncbi:alpha/beta hydrolase [Pandoraea nosoerga]|uniref:esterase/lipase family protein n=1 Tax=Pandoraea nosoerga TaxID=2508296 RepID=UPI00197DF42A|nr:alpha/beta fold hydrolase [Pandoraea nosoerga]MBN4668277.1 alpha/beta hydrolase [Pandoraea nosoerga]MBN4678051.1 alpha/beta hydrolase [Pandoraea nosoerga]MBN4683257.1 alpha/beta hydrolase [Pandoraea nosoerga]MBN4747178.1 alpha/beta hydrolase [Pandoraea nosoerga]
MTTPPPAAARRARPSRPHLVYGGVQVGLSLVVAAATWSAWHNPWATVLWTMLWLPVSHAIALAAGFVMAAQADPTPARRAPAGVGIATWAYECAASILLLDLYQPWRSAAPLPAPSGPARAVAVLLLHGYGCNRAFWLRFARHLADAGYQCDAINLGPIFGDIDEYAPQIAGAAQALAERTRLPVVIVGHSMGGLAARACLSRHPTLPVAHTITLGSPHFGTLHARHGFGVNVRQMGIGSEWLIALANRETDAERAHHLDLHVSRQRGVSHAHLGVARRAQRCARSAGARVARHASARPRARARNAGARGPGTAARRVTRQPAACCGVRATLQDSSATRR